MRSFSGTNRSSNYLGTVLSLFSLFRLCAINCAITRKIYFIFVDIGISLAFILILLQQQRIYGSQIDNTLEICRVKKF